MLSQGYLAFVEVARGPALASCDPDAVRWSREPEMSRELIDWVPEGELTAAQRFLEYLASNPAYRAALAAPPDDEPVTSDDAEDIVKAREDVRAGRAVSHYDVLRDFGLR
jgi:hypothetical protein